MQFHLMASKDTKVLLVLCLHRLTNKQTIRQSSKRKEDVDPAETFALLYCSAKEGFFSSDIKT